MIQNRVGPPPSFFLQVSRLYLDRSSSSYSFSWLECISSPVGNPLQPPLLLPTQERLCHSYYQYGVECIFSSTYLLATTLIMNRYRALSIIRKYMWLWGTAVSQWLRSLVRFQLVSLEFFIYIKSFRPHYGPGVDSASNRNEYQEYFLGAKAAGA